MNELPTYEVPPIIILVTEEDDAAYRSIIKNKDVLYAMGYRHLNFELCSNDTLQSVLKVSKATIDVRNMIMKKPIKQKLDDEYMEWHPILRRHLFVQGSVDLLENIQTDKKWSISFIDIKKEEMFKKPNSLEFRAPLEELKPKREAKYAEEINNSSTQYKGGTITIIGNNHYTVYDQLTNTNPGLAESALFFAFQKYFPLEAPLSSSLLKELDEGRKNSYQLNTKNRIELLTTYFPKGTYHTLSISEEKFTNMVDTLFLQHIKNKIQSLKDKFLLKEDGNENLKITSTMK